MTDHGRVVAEPGLPGEGTPGWCDRLVLGGELIRGRGGAFPEPLPPRLRHAGPGGAAPAARGRAPVIHLDTSALAKLVQTEVETPAHSRSR
ncbi:hypothetical protein Q5530_19825 [Saccharothrix sp. BKS2]|uniref:hypothetical protein n=1 Tax=Saccharothrix sp. BKS2 TaxID=3064400 RepID=UPI0039EAE5CE